MDAPQRTQQTEQLTLDDSNESKPQDVVLKEIGVGIKFGGDHLGYTTDAKTTHSRYIITLVESDMDTIPVASIIRMGRVAANTGKEALLCDRSGQGVVIDWKMREKTM